MQSRARVKCSLSIGKVKTTPFLFVSCFSDVGIRRELVNETLAIIRSVILAIT